MTESKPRKGKIMNVNCSCENKKWIKVTFDRYISSLCYEKRGVQQCNDCLQYYHTTIKFGVGTGHNDKFKPLTIKEARALIKSSKKV